MAERLGALYHWSPTARRRSIERSGLVLGKANTVTTDEEGFKQPHICLSPTPSMAWALSGAMNWAPRGDWDLWQVWLEIKDDVQIRPNWGAKIEEVRVRNRIYKRQLWLVGTRTK